MEKAPKPRSTRKPPAPSDDHAVIIDDWLRTAMPDLQPILRRLDEMIREAHAGLHYAVKWKKAYYGLPDHGWIVELVAYDVSVNLVLLGGAAFAEPPPLGEGESRYVKVRSVEEVEQPELRRWIEQAGGVAGWSWDPATAAGSP